MKNLVASLFILLSFQFTSQPLQYAVPQGNYPTSQNVFIITLDGFRWQEVFNGADTNLLNNPRLTPDNETLKLLYASPEAEGRRKQLLPFFWNVIANHGQLYGNRKYNNKVNTANAYSISYPGYNEIFTGSTDLSISSNNKIPNPNTNVLEYLNSIPSLRGEIAAFTSWELFPYILNQKRSGIVLNSGYQEIDAEPGSAEAIINRVQDETVIEKTGTRQDQLTFLAAREYLKRKHPRLLYLGLGETDEAAHNGRYDEYLEKANQADRIIAELWHFVQTTPGYKDQTTFIITTDHGRGKKPGTWSQHGMFISGSSQTWLAVMGPSITPAGEVKENQQYYQEQVARTIASLLGEEFSSNGAAAALNLQAGDNPIQQNN